jgi:hypothetical protein
MFAALAISLLASPASAQQAEDKASACPKDEAPRQSGAPAIGTGFHLFKKNYWLIGMNWSAPCRATALELETSVVPEFLISRGLWWAGAWASAGYQIGHGDATGPCDLERDQIRKRDALEDLNQLNGTRFAGGLEGGWRMLTVDAGLLHNHALSTGNAFRVRGGITLSQETFTGSTATYRRGCCEPARRSTPCECDRTPIGVSVFAYYAYEYYFIEEWSDGMVGVSLKVGFGL